MRRTSVVLVRLFVLAVGSATLPTNAQAGIELSLVSVTQPDRLPIGGSARFQVVLSGLEEGQKLDYLAATIEYDRSLLGVPATNTIAAGAIVPSPLFDSYDFVSVLKLDANDPSLGLADASFSTFPPSTKHIQTNGVFFEFTVPVLREGIGWLGFRLVDATQYNAADPSEPLPIVLNSGPALALTSVPEPGTLGLLTATLLAVTLYGSRRPTFSF